MVPGSPNRIGLVGPLLIPEPSRRAQPVVVSAGPAFALIAPTTYVAEAAPPSHALHPQAHHDLAASGAEMVVLVICIVILTKAVIVRVFDAAGNLLASAPQDRPRD